MSEMIHPVLITSGKRTLPQFSLPGSLVVDHTLKVAEHLPGAPRKIPISDSEKAIHFISL